jgi:uncharacterized protein with GYD domain
MTGYGTKRTYRDGCYLSAFGVTGQLMLGVRFSPFDPTATLVAAQPHRIPSVPPLLREKRPMLRPPTGMPPRSWSLESVVAVAVMFGAHMIEQAKLLSRRDAMPIYISRGRFTSDAVKGMLAKPENREEAVAKLFESVGGRLIGWYLTFGHHDWLVIAEFPDEKAAASAILAAAAGGSLSEIETTVAMTAKDAHATFESAGKAAKGFRSAGRS